MTEKIFVNSSMVRSFQYFNDTQVLEIEFVNGGSYEYFDVPQHVYDDLLSLSQNGGSVGQYVSRSIRKSYRHSKL